LVRLLELEEISSGGSGGRQDIWRDIGIEEEHDDEKRFC
jgi:hypothetical protein